MTGRELILYILSNNLEDEPVFKDGKFIGTMTITEAAVQSGIGAATVLTHVALENIDCYYPKYCLIPANQIEKLK